MVLSIATDVLHCSKFGGNPNHVVLGGNSAGAASITLLLSAYGGRDDHLFHASVAESQSFAYMLTSKQSQFLYNGLASRTGCRNSSKTLRCLQSLDVDTLQEQNFDIPYPGAKSAPLYAYGPTIDGDLVPDYTYALFERGQFIKVPTIFGDDTNEGTIFVPQNTSSVEDADTFIADQFPNIQQSEIEKINDMYLSQNQTVAFPSSGPYWRSASNAYGEMRYNCPGIYLSSVYSDSQVSNWNYHYAVEDPTLMASGDGVPHTIETNAIWGPKYVSGTPPSSYFTSNAPIMPLMQGYWTSFIMTFNPNTRRQPGSPVWQKWNSGEGYQRLHIETGDTMMETVPDDQKDRCKYLTGIGVGVGQ